MPACHAILIKAIMKDREGERTVQEKLEWLERAVSLHCDNSTDNIWSYDIGLVGAK